MNVSRTHIRYSYHQDSKRTDKDICRFFSFCAAVGSFYILGSLDGGFDFFKSFFVYFVVIRAIVF